MQRVLFLFLLLGTCCSSCISKKKPELGEKEVVFSLKDFYGDNSRLDQVVDSSFNILEPEERVAQMIIAAAGKNGKPTKTIDRLIQKGVVGGLLMLSGEKEDLIELVHRFDSLSLLHDHLPLIYSSDAEPSLLNLKIKGTQKVPKTVTLETPDMCDSVTQLISDELLSMGIKHNFAPVVDMSPNNEAITNRTFGNDSAKVVSLASVFINSSQNAGVAATAKHFPGHGLVSGDTHNQLVTIDGEMKEVNNYIPLIEQGVVSIMVGHIAVTNNEEYNTDGMPASCSRIIVTNLLKQKLGFKGIVVTDAMNMGALRKINNASLKAVEAGCDMILMEPNDVDLHKSILKKYNSNPVFKSQVDQSVKKILRLKTCLSII